jgi:hypothetical protein
VNLRLVFPVAVYTSESAATEGFELDGECEPGMRGACSVQRGPWVQCMDGCAPDSGATNGKQRAKSLNLAPPMTVMPTRRVAAVAGLATGLTTPGTAAIEQPGTSHCETCILVGQLIYVTLHDKIDALLSCLISIWPSHAGTRAFEPQSFHTHLNTLVPIEKVRRRNMAEQPACSNKQEVFRGIISETSVFSS